MKKLMIAAVLATAFGIAAESKAEDRAWVWSPVGIGLAAPLQIPYMSSDVLGLRLGGFFAYNNLVRGVDVGVAEISTASFDGLAVAGFEWIDGNARGLLVSAVCNYVADNAYGVEFGLVNDIRGDAYGLQVGGINCSGALVGLQAGVVDWNKLPAYGLQAALLNMNRGRYNGLAVGGFSFAEELTGAQVGAFNFADEVTGVQIGLVNACDEMHGVQIGLVNLITESPLPAMVFANVAF